MLVKDIIRDNQPDVYKELRSNNTKDKDREFREYENLMRHDSYKRHNGAIKQR
ncbi:MAG: hypothetical protein RR851_13170 [Clostridium sp.]